MATALSKTSKELAHHEAIIDDGLKSFLHVGRSLIAIRDGSLYEEGYDTFEQYCQKRWNFTRQRAYQLVEAAETVDSLKMSTIVDIKTENPKQKTQIPLPENEAQARALSTSADHPEERAKVWAAAVEAAPKADDGSPKVTAASIKRAAEQVLGPAPEKLKPETNGKPSGGTKFDPSEFDPAIEPDGEPTSAAGLPKHLVPVLADYKEYRSLQREVSLLYGKVEALARKPIGSYIILQEIERTIGQVKANLKSYGFGNNCPDCENTPKKTCLRCKGRGWIAQGQLGSLSDLHKLWLESHGVKP